jgi:hypothetical protein
MQLFATTPITFGTIKMSVKCTENDLLLCILPKHVKKYGRWFTGRSQLHTDIIIDKVEVTTQNCMLLMSMIDHNCLTNTQRSDLLAPLPKCIIQKRFILPVRQILKSTNFIFHLSGCDSLTSAKFFSSLENYSTNSGDNEPSLTPVNRGLAC